MTNQNVINFLNQVRKILLDDKSWLESTIQPINEAFDIAISALQAQDLQQSCNNIATDTISRTAAIDVVKSLMGDYELSRTVQTGLHILPSAQPDGIPLEWIDKHLEWLDNCDNDFAQLAKVGIRAMVEIWKKDKT